MAAPTDLMDFEQLGEVGSIPHWETSTFQYPATTSHLTRLSRKPVLGPIVVSDYIN